ncbi:GNAT family N-acetyltransferase [Sporomusa termitida]|uniref:RimI: ribosomal-protein-alanine acetyltransferase n=1 Tax=Sporomusa termitida TaxID=2377 RepID=A0A517DRM3_9FIRM|nr:GNAT family N-acetyltransferase [Sporomusa termitida]QDR80014.1 rimI: ribosomal-protein-alanine acetyltransferase [Sporomusa termitida]
MSANTFEHMTIEKVQRPDLAQLEQLFASAFGEEIDAEQIRRRIHRTRQFYYILHPLSKFSTWVKNHFTIYVVKIAGQVIGFIQLSSLNPTQLHVDYIAFSKQYRGLGLGTWVLTKLLNDVADVNDYDVVLEVRVDNPAYSFYQRLGFGQVTQILHYEKPLRSGCSWPEQQTETISGFRELRGGDRAKLYRLYLESVPLTLRRVIKRTYGEFNPSMMVRGLEWIKNNLMRKQQKDYVVEQQGKIVALLTINSYFKANSHIFSLILHPAHEQLRRAIIEKAGSILMANGCQGVISTTIYSDDSAKQITLADLGFKNNLAYYLMFRPSALRQKELSRVLIPAGQPVLTGRKPLGNQN